MVSPDVTKRALAALSAHRQNARGSQQQQSISPADFKAQLARYRIAPPKKETDWDKFWRPGINILNALGAGGYGTEGAFNASIDQAEQTRKKFEAGDGWGALGSALTTPFAMVGRGIEAAGNALTGKADKNVTGSDVIEHLTDFTGTGFDKNYVDREDNVNPWVKGIGGFALDVASDPLTWVPGGAIASVARGGVKGAVEAARLAKGGDLAKTFAAGKSLLTPGHLSSGLPVPFNQAAVDELGKWAVKRTAQKADKAQIKANVQAIRNGTATDADKAWLVGAAPKKAAKAMPAEEVATIAATKAAERAADDAAEAAAKAADEIPTGEPLSPDMLPSDLPKTPKGKGKGKGKVVAPAAKTTVPAATVDLDPVAIHTTEEAADLAEMTDRARAAARAGDAYTAGVAAMPLQSADVLTTLRKLSYEKNLRSQKVQEHIRGLRPRPMGVAGMDKVATKALNDAQSAWGTRVEEIFQDKGATQKILRQIKDPNEFKDTVRKLASEKVVANYSDAQPAQIFKGLAQKSRTHNEEQLAAFAKMIGLDKRNWGKKDGIVSWGDFFKLRKNVRADYFDKAALAEKANAKLLHESQVPDAAVIEKVAETMSPGEAMGAAATDLADLANTLSPAEQARYLSSLTASGKAAFAIGDKRVYKRTGTPRNTWTDRQGETVISSVAESVAKGENPPTGEVFIKSHILEQYKTYSYTAKLLSASAAEAKRLGLSGAARDEFMYDDLLKGAQFHDSYYRSIGVSPVTGRHMQEGTRFKNRGAEWAFLGFSDVLKALPKPIVQAVLLAGKDHSLAPTLIHNMARWALKLSGTVDMSDGDKIATVMQELHKAVDDLADSASKKYMATPEGHERILALMDTLFTPDTMASLAKANIRNGAFARTIVGAQAHRMSEASMKIVTGALKSPNGTAGSDVDAVLKSMQLFRDTVKREGMSASDAAVVGQFDLERVIAQNLEIGQAKAIRAAVRMRAEQTAGKSAADLAKAEKEVADKVSGPTPGGKRKTPHGTVKTVAQVKEAAKIKAATDTARADQVRAIAPEVEEYMNAVVGPDLAASAEKAVDLDWARAQASMGLPAWMNMMRKVGETMSGGFGFRNLQPTEIAFAISTRNHAAMFTGAVDKFQKKYGRAVTDGAWAILRKMDGNDGLDAALVGLDETTAAAAKELWPLMKTVFDHSDHNLFARLGFKADYINDFLRKMGVDRDYWLVPGKEGHEVGRQWKSWEFDEAHDPMQTMALYNKAIQQAMVVPGIAASFSAEFGHTSNWLAKAMTDEEAIAAGWKKVVKKDGSLSDWLDQTQYYDPKMIDQLAMLDNYLGKSVILNEDKVFDKVFRHMDHIINAMKATITVWRPGHHVTNITGEALFNTLAGVWNPARYGDALRTLASQGLVEGKSGDQIFDTLQRLAPDGFELRQTDLGKGVLMTIGGTTRSISYDSAFKMLDEAGIVLHHTVAEDFLTESTEMLGRKPSPLAPISKAVAPQWLASASANRDNVFRLAHALDLLSKHSYRNVDDAMKQIATEIHSYHPTMQTLSAVEQKYVRRYIYFYTWQRQALSRVMESLIEQPGRVMVAPKAIFNAAQANGIDSQSWGEPMPNDPRLPDYSVGTINSALWLGAPGGTEGQPADHIWGADINAPQLDILQQVFGAIKVNPDKSPGEQITDSIGQFATGAILQNLTPLIKAPVELGTKHKFGTGAEIKNANEYLLDQTGLRIPSVLGAFGERSDTPDTETLRKAQNERTIANYFLGAKITDYTTPKSANGAYMQRQEELRRMFEAKQ